MSTRENELSHEIIGAGIEVHRELGPGLLESAYQAAMVHELQSRNLAVESERTLPVCYKGVGLDAGYRLDIVVEEKVVVEVKAVDALCDLHEAQLLTYLKLGGYKLGLLMNFNVPMMRDGIKRVVLGL